MSALSYVVSMSVYILLLFLCLAAFGIEAKNLPDPTGKLVSDYIQLLSSSEIQTLERKLVAYNDSTSTQIAVVIESSLEGDDIFEYSFRVAEKWGIGRSGKDNGILLYIAFNDRKLYIQTGSGTEGFLPDALAKRIIENTIIPAFRNQQYFTGLDKATNIIMQLGSGEYVSEGKQSAFSQDSDKIAGGIVLFIFFIIFKTQEIVGKVSGFNKISKALLKGFATYTGQFMKNFTMKINLKIYQTMP